MPPFGLPLGAAVHGITVTIAARAGAGVKIVDAFAVAKVAAFRSREVKPLNLQSNIGRAGV